MRRHLALLIVLAAIGLAAIAPANASWIFSPSYFSHDPATGVRVAQYVPVKTPYARTDENYLESGYRHQRSSIRVGGSVDHTHVVETWGEGERIRPYGEWQRPFRKGATPFGPWGNRRGPWTSPFGGAWMYPYGFGPFASPGGYPMYGPPSAGPYRSPGGLPPDSGPVSPPGP